MNTRFILLFSLITCYGIAETPDCDMTARGAKIDTTEVVQIGGIEQVINIKGGDRTRPVLLYLHGGPGESVMEKAEAFTSELQNHFVVVQWDQRDTGKTLERNESKEPLTIELMQRDTKAVVDHLLRKFRQKKLYLVGHLWGTVLGFYMADKYPQLLYAYVAISPMIKPAASDRRWVDQVIDFEKEKGNQKALAELATVKIPFETFDQMFTARKWLSDYEGQPVPDSLVATYKKKLGPWKNRWFSLAMDANRQDLFKTLPSVKCPVYFFAGRKDFQTHFSITEQYYEALKAPVKKLFWFENSGHLVPNTEPEKMQAVIIEQILPGIFK